MAQFINMFEVDLKRSTSPQPLRQMVCEGDSNANRVGVYVYNDGASYGLGGTCVGKVVRADGATVTLTGTISGNSAYVVLDQQSCAVEGAIQVAVCWVSGTNVTTLLIAYGTVVNTQTGQAIQPSTPIPDLTELLAEIENMREATQAAIDATAGAAQFAEFIDDFTANAPRVDIETTSQGLGTYWNCEGSTAYVASASGFKAYYPVTVAVGEVYTIYNRSGSTHKAQPYLVTDDAYNIISSPGDQYGEPTKLYSIVIPEGGTKLLLTSVNDAGPLLKKVVWSDTIDTSKSLKFRNSISAMGVTVLSTLRDSGWYGCGADYVASITDLPAYIDASSPLNIFVFPYAFNSGSSGTINAFTVQMLINRAGQMYIRNIANNTGTASDWVQLGGGNTGANALQGKRVAIIGDSISTNGNTGAYPNVPEIVIADADVGVELNAWLTYWDVYNTDDTATGLTIGGHTFTSSEIGTKVTFTPVAADIGKMVGKPLNYNPASTTVWWEVLMQVLNIVPIPVCWSGSSITSHELSNDKYKTSCAFHEAQCRKCGVRIPGTMNRYPPDVIIIYRGVNDFSHSPYAVLTDGYFDALNWQYPETDVVSGNYGFKEGMARTVRNLRIMWPNAKIFMCTLNTFKRVNYEHFPINNGLYTLPQLNDAIRECADFFGCGLIEFDKDGITFENCYSGGYITDSETIPTHPNDKGHRVMGLKAVTDLNAQYSAMS